MLISRDVSQVSARFSIERTEDGVTLDLSYKLSEDSAPGEGESAWSGTLSAKLGQDTASVEGDSADPLVLSLDSDLADGVTYKGSYTLVDDSDGVDVTFDFTVTSFLQKGVFEGDGAADYVFGSGLDDDLSGGAGDDVFCGMGGADVLTGGAGDDSLRGGAGADELKGGAGDDFLKGNLGADTLKGGIGDDWLTGRQGSDELVGGDGADKFVFFTELTNGDVDTIVDFVSGEDQIVLGAHVFTALAGLEELDGAHFTANETGKALDADDLIIYDTKTGELFYDADGSGAGAAILFATLKPVTEIHEQDFLIV